MNFRLKTDNDTGAKLKVLQSSTGLTPNILARISIALSLLDSTTPQLVESESDGLEFNRNTLTGEQDYIYKTLIKEHANKNISEEEYFPSFFNAHLSRGVKLLTTEYNLSSNYPRLLNNLISLTKEQIKG